MITQFVPCSLPFFDTKKPQFHRLWWTKGALEVARCYTPLTALPPFVTKTNAANSPGQALLVAVDNESSQVDITTWLTYDTGTESSNKWCSFLGDAVIDPDGEVSPGDFLSDPVASEGEALYKNWVAAHKAGGFYIQVKFGSNWQYGDIFYIEDMVTGDPSTKCNRVRVEWWDTECAIGELRYDLVDIENSLYLASDSGRPEYVPDTEDQEDSDNETFPFWQKMIKRSEIQVFVSEHVADAVSLIPMHSHCQITDQYGNSYQIPGRQVEVSIEWETGGVARCSIRYYVNYVEKSCCL